MPFRPDLAPFFSPLRNLFALTVPDHALGRGLRFFKQFFLRKPCAPKKIRWEGAPHAFSSLEEGRLFFFFVERCPGALTDDFLLFFPWGRLLTDLKRPLTRDFPPPLFSVQPFPQRRESFSPSKCQIAYLHLPHIIPPPFYSAEGLPFPVPALFFPPVLTRRFFVL